MSQPGKNGRWERVTSSLRVWLTVTRTAGQSDGGKIVGVDPTVITARNTPMFRLFTFVHSLTIIADARKLSDKIQKKGGKALVGVKENLVDIVWGNDRPPRPNEPVKTLGVEFAGKKFEDKLEDLRKELEKKKSPGFVVCTLYNPA